MSDTSFLVERNGASWVAREVDWSAERLLSAANVRNVYLRGTETISVYLPTGTSISREHVMAVEKALGMDSRTSATRCCAGYAQGYICGVGVLPIPEALPPVPVVEVRAGSMRVYEHNGCHGVWLPPDILEHMGAKTGEFLYPLLGPKGEIRLLGENRYQELLKEDDSDRAQ